MKPDYFTASSVRLMRFLYSLGFEKISVVEGDTEVWMFKKSNELQESLDFYFRMRQRLRTGVNSNESK
jgi:hypothetical protein